MRVGTRVASDAAKYPVLLLSCTATEYQDMPVASQFHGLKADRNENFLYPFRSAEHIMIE
jgi:hypothetical protein